MAPAIDVGQSSRDAGAPVPAVIEQTNDSEGSLSSATFPILCTGKRRALLIGIRISKAEGYPELKGAHGDVYKMRDLLIDVYDYKLSEITILVDDGIEGHVQPTRDNIRAAISELVKDVKAGDQLCFHYAGHSTQIPNERSNSEEDGMDECLIPLDGLIIIDNELHDTLVRPLPAGAHLVAVLDTCNSGSLLDLKHYRCNRVLVPWIWRGRRSSEEIRNGIVRRGARLVTLSQTTGSVLQTHNAPTAPARAPARNVISVMCDPPASSAPASRSSTGLGGLARTGSGLVAKSGPPRTGTIARMRAGSAALKGSLDRLRTLSLSIPSGDKEKDQDKNKENLTSGDVGSVLPAFSKLSWILPEEEAHCESPVAQFPCNGWCRNVEGHSTLIDEADEVKADVISLASCKDSQRAWEGDDGASMTSSLVELLRENPHQSLKDVLLKISHATYSLALMRHSRSKQYKKQRTDYIAWLRRKINGLEHRNQSTTSLALPDGSEPTPTIAPRPTMPHATVRGMNQKGVRRVGHIAWLKQTLKDVLMDSGYDTNEFQNPELSSPRPLNMGRPWKM